MLTVVAVAVLGIGLVTFAAHVGVEAAAYPPVQHGRPGITDDRGSPVSTWNDAPVLPGVSMASVQRALPPAWHVTLAPAGHGAVGDFTDPVTGGFAQARVGFSDQTDKDTSRVTDLECTFNRTGDPTGSRVLPELESCLDAALPVAPRVAVANWLTATATAATQTRTDASPTIDTSNSFPPYRLAVTLAKGSLWAILTRAAR